MEQIVQIFCSTRWCHDNAEDSKIEVLYVWNRITPAYRVSLLVSISNRYFEVIKRNGCAIKYWSYCCTAYSFWFRIQYFNFFKLHSHFELNWMILWENIFNGMACGRFKLHTLIQCGCVIIAIYLVPNSILGNVHNRILFAQF